MCYSSLAIMNLERLHARVDLGVLVTLPKLLTDDW
jgi:hypothetical protein